MLRLLLTDEWEGRGRDPLEVFSALSVSTSGWSLAGVARGRREGQVLLVICSFRSHPRLPVSQTVFGWSRQCG